MKRSVDLDDNSFDQDFEHDPYENDGGLELVELKFTLFMDVIMTRISLGYNV